MKMITPIIIVLAILIVVPSISSKTDSEKIDDILLKNQDIEKKLDSILKSSQSQISVFGTEYQVGDDTKTFIQLLQDEATPINNATCFLTYWYPDNSVWLSNQLMTYLPTSNGLYYYDSIAQSQTGVYMIDAYCQYTTESIPFNATGVIVKNGTIISGNNFSVSQSDNDRFVITESGLTATNGTIFPMLQFKFDETSGNVTLEEVSGTYQNVFGNPDLSVTGISNTGIDFDGVDDYIVINNTGEYNFNATEDIVVCLAIKTDGDFPNNDYVIDMKDGGGEGWEIRGADDQLRFSTDRAGSGNKNHETLFNFNDNVFHTYCGLSSFEEMVSYVDGVFDRQTTPAQSGEMNTTEGYRIGTDSTNSDYIEEILDELCVFRGVNLNISAIATQYNTSRSCDGIGTSTDKISLEVTIGNVTFSNDSNGFSISTEYQWSDLTENLNVHVYNYSASSYYKLTNPLIYSATDNIITSLFNGNYTDFISGNTMLVKYNGTTINDSFKGTLRIDQTKLLFHVWVDTPIDEIRGGGELHVEEYNFSKLNTIASDVWTYSDRQLTEFNFDVVNETEITENVWNYSGIISNNILTQFTSNIWNYTGAIATNILTNFASQIWNFPERNLTFIPAVNTTLVINTTEISENVWSFTPDRNLTFYPTTVNATLIQESLNATTPEVFVGGTEYITDEIGGISIRLVKAQGSASLPVLNAMCNVSIIYPNNTLFVNSQSMNEFGDGVYTYNFTTPSTFGVYTYFTDCVDTNNKNYYALDTFHVTELNLSKVSESIWTYTPDRNLTFYPDTTDETNYTLINELIENRSDLTNYTLIADLIGAINITDLTNYTLINNLIEDRTDITNYTLVFELIENRTLYDLTNYTLITEIIEARNQSDLTNYTLIADLIGGINITDLTNYSLIIDIIANRSDLTNYTEIYNLIENRTVYDLTNYTLVQDLITTYGNNLSASQIWNFPERNLTFYELVDVSNLTVNVNASFIAQEVWDYSGNINSNILNQFGDTLSCYVERFIAENNGEWGVNIPVC